MNEHGTFSRYASKKYACRCVPCTAAATEYQRQRRKNRPDVTEQNRRQSADYRRSKAAYVREVKSKPCTDCGLLYPYYVMQFDHLRDKKFTIAKLNTSIEKLKEEIEKCELVCANCHMERTHKRRNAIDF